MLASKNKPNRPKDICPKGHPARYQVAFGSWDCKTCKKVTHDYITIEVGDFIKARGTLCMGLVLRIGSIKAGKATIQGYVIQDCHGREDFIDEGSAEFIAR
jgi:hypothetical protein